MSAVYTRRPSRALFAEIAAILDEITGIRWGFVPTSGGKSVRYFTSVEFPVRVFPLVAGERNRAPRRQSPLDVLVEVKTPARFTSTAAWREQMRGALVSALVDAQSVVQPPRGVTQTLTAAPPSAYSAAVYEADRNRRGAGPLSPPVDLYTEDCERWRGE